MSENTITFNLYELFGKSEDSAREALVGELADRLNGTVREMLKPMLQEAIAKAITEQLKLVIGDAIDSFTIQPVESWGAPKGEPISLKAHIMNVVDHQVRIATDSYNSCSIFDTKIKNLVEEGMKKIHKDVSAETNKRIDAQIAPLVSDVLKKMILVK